MSTLSLEQLASKHCAACEGNVEKLNPRQVEKHLKTLDGWRLTPDGNRILKQWQAKDFMEALRFLNRVAEVAESEGHHPDFHLESYRSVRIELWTHALGGLSENDFILAAKIDQLPITLKSSGG
jgi:4a-hydroxytetrahydrobiopterin dehydratase